jgi:hypothetical protein
MTFNNLRVGQMISFLVPNGIGRHGVEWKKKKGRVVMAFASHVVCNGGGKHGTPHVVNERNFTA